MIIRTAAEADFAALAELWAECGLTRAWNDPLQDMAFALQGPASTILVGEEQGSIIASVMAGHDGHRGVLYYLAVKPAHQGQGLGRAMHEAAVQWLRARGVWKINLMVRSENEKVRGFYEGLGYAPNAVISFGKRIDA